MTDSEKVLKQLGSTDSYGDNMYKPFVDAYFASANKTEFMNNPLLSSAKLSMITTMSGKMFDHQGNKKILYGGGGAKS